jgi:hypothetical protein
MMDARRSKAQGLTNPGRDHGARPRRFGVGYASSTTTWRVGPITARVTRVHAETVAGYGETRRHPEIRPLPHTGTDPVVCQEWLPRSVWPSAIRRWPPPRIALRNRWGPGIASRLPPGFRSRSWLSDRGAGLMAGDDGDRVEGTASKLISNVIPPARMSQPADSHVPAAASSDPVSARTASRIPMFR